MNPVVDRQVSSALRVRAILLILTIFGIIFSGLGVHKKQDWSWDSRGSGDVEFGLQAGLCGASLLFSLTDILALRYGAQNLVHKRALSMMVRSSTDLIFFCLGFVIYICQWIQKANFAIIRTYANIILLFALLLHLHAFLQVLRPATGSFLEYRLMCPACRKNGGLNDGNPEAAVKETAVKPIWSRGDRQNDPEASDLLLHRESEDVERGEASIDPCPVEDY